MPPPLSPRFENKAVPCWAPGCGGPIFFPFSKATRRHKGHKRYKYLDIWEGRNVDRA